MGKNKFPLLGPLAQAGEALPHQPASDVAEEAAASVPGSASEVSASFLSTADSTGIVGSSRNRFQCLDLSKGWDLDWGLCSGLPQTVDPKEEKGEESYCESKEENRSMKIVT